MLAFTIFVFTRRVAHSGHVSMLIIRVISEKELFLDKLTRGLQALLLVGPMEEKMNSTNVKQKSAVKAK